MVDIIRLAGLEQIGTQESGEANYLADFHEHMSKQISAAMHVFGASRAITSTSALTAKSVRESMQRAIAVLNEFKPVTDRLGHAFEMFGAVAGGLMGMPIHEIRTDFLPRLPVRIHRRQRWDRSGSYHRRVQKKWNKRFGTRADESVFYLLDGQRILAGRRMIDRLRVEIGS